VDAAHPSWRLRRLHPLRPVPGQPGHFIDFIEPADQPTQASGRRRLARTSLRDASPFGLAMPHGGLTRRSPVRHITFRRSARLFALGRGQRDERTDHPHFRRGW